MQVEWEHHSSELVQSLASFLTEGVLHDVTLCSSEGKRIRAHRVILSASSEYFKVYNILSNCQYISIIVFELHINNISDYNFMHNPLLQEILVSTDNEDPGKIPIIFLKDISYTELDCLIQYIYTGKAILPDGFNLSSFTELAKSLGISGNNLLIYYISLP